MAILNITTDVLPYLQRAADDSYGNVARVLAAVEAYVKTYCNRNFESASYKEVISDFRGGRINLKNYPIISISKITTMPLGVIRVYNTNKYSTATAQVTSTGITLTYNGSALTVAFATYTTLGAVVTQINALGSGWVAELVNSDYSTILSTELILDYGQSAINSKDVYLSILGDNIDYGIHDANAGIVETSLYYDTVAYSRFVSSSRSYPVLYINYTAGYASADLPKDLKQGMLTLIAYQYNRVSNATQGIKSFTIGDYSIGYEGIGRAEIPQEVTLMLDNYRYLAF